MSRPKAISDKERIAWLCKNCLGLLMLLDGSWDITYTKGAKVAHAYGPDIESTVDAAILSERKAKGVKRDQA